MFARAGGGDYTVTKAGAFGADTTKICISFGTGRTPAAYEYVFVDANSIEIHSNSGVGTPDADDLMLDTPFSIIVFD